jgi:hypothetical protein
MKRVVHFCVALGLILAVPAAVLAQQYEGVAVKSGQATAKHAGKDFVFTYAEGGFQQVSGFTMATIVFKLDAKSKVNTHLNLTLMYQAPGKIDLDGKFSMSGLGMFMDGDVARFTKGKSQCTITLTKATPTEVEGTADCPLLHNISGEVMPALTVQKFSATVK